MFIKVRVEAESKKEGIEKLKDDTFVVRVKEKTERNMANKKVVAILNYYYNITGGTARIMVGHKNTNKIIEIPNND